MPTTIHLGGRSCVLVERKEYDRLTALARMENLPPLPEPDAKRNYPALEYARASLARDIIRARVEAGLTQRELAELAGIREETVCRIETGKHTPSVPTIEKIDRVLREAERRKRQPSGTHTPGKRGRRANV